MKDNILSFPYPLKFKYNIRSEKEGALKGYNWGVEAADSDIIKDIARGRKKTVQDILNELELCATDIVSERWITADDPEYSSVVVFKDGSTRDFCQILKENAVFMLGERYVELYGSYLSVIMKQINTSKESPKGSLSVQVHPKEGIKGTVAKPEMWMGKGKIYLGWKEDMTRDKIIQAVNNSDLEKYMNNFDMAADDLIMVHGGVVHATRYDSTFFEWSKSLTKDELLKGSIKKATYALYDRVDGKQPRPGKENLEDSIDIIDLCDGFKKRDDFFCEKKELYKKDDGSVVSSLFNTPAVEVEELRINSSLDFTFEYGWSFFVAKGDLTIAFKEDAMIYSEGDEGFIPAALKSVRFKNESSTDLIVYRWYPGKLN